MDGKRLKTLLLILGLTFLLRLPSLFEPFTYGDEGVYLTLGQAIRDGLVLYRDIYDNKPPLIYLLAALAGGFSYFRLTLFIWSFATIFVFWKLSRLLFNQDKKAIIATAAFAILTSLHTFEGNIANAENFMLLPTIGGFYLLLKITPLFGKNQFLWFSTGILFSLATLFKIPAAFDFAAALVFISITCRPVGRFNYLLLISGFLLPILATIVYFASQNALNQYLTAAFAQNLPYLSSWTPDKSKVGTFPLALFGRGLALGLMAVFLIIFRKRLSLPFKLILVWFSFSLFAALLSSRPYPHYLIQVLPALSLSLGLLLTKKKLVPLGLLTVLTVVFVLFRFWHYPNFSYYLNFYQFLGRIKSQEEYFGYFGEQTKTIYQLASWLRIHTLSSEKIFIWGNDPSVYALSRRLPVGRYTVAYHIIDFNGYQETMTQLRKNPPRYLITMRGEKRSFPDLAGFVDNYYLLEKDLNGTKIFRRQSII